MLGLTELTFVERLGDEEASCDKGCAGKGNSLKWSMPGILEEWLGLLCDWCQVSEWEESSVESAGE